MYNLNMKSNCMKDYHPANMYYCPKTNNPEGHVSNIEAVNMAYNKRGGNFCNVASKNMGSNHACKPNDVPTMSELAWGKRYNVGVTASKWPRVEVVNQSGGGYYLDLSNAPIGGRARVSTYPNCCPPVFCGNLTGGKKKFTKYERVGYGINELSKITSFMKKSELNKMLNKMLRSNSKNLVKYDKMFNKKTLKTITSILMLNTYVNKNKNQIKNLNKIPFNNKLHNIFSYLNEVTIKNKNPNKMHKGGAYPIAYYPLGYFIAPLGVNFFSVTALLFLMNMLYKVKQKTIGGGYQQSKSNIIKSIENIINPIQNMYISKDTIKTLGDIKCNVISKMKINRTKCKKNLSKKGGGKAFTAFAKINPAPLNWDMRNDLFYKNSSALKRLNNEFINEHNQNQFLK